jgi:hypothetical protein
VNVVIIA